MSPSTPILLALLGAFLPALGLSAQTDPTPPQTTPIENPDSYEHILDLDRWTLRDLTLYWENDGTLPNIIDDTDRYYTNAVKIELSIDPNLPEPLQDRLTPDSWSDTRFGLGLAIEQRIYTPEDLQRQNPPAREHPYAGYLALSLTLQRAEQHTHDALELELGIVGPAAASETIQKWIHNTFPDEIFPLGWDTQLSNEPTINLNYTRTWRTDKADLGGLHLDLLPQLGADLGTVRIAARSRMTARFGYNLPDNFGPPSILTQNDHTIDRARALPEDKPFSLYLYTSLAIDYIARDIFIDGNAFASSRSAKREPLLATFSIGLAAQYKSFYLGWTQHIQTERFELQPNNQHYGSIVFGLSVPW